VEGGKKEQGWRLQVAPEEEAGCMTELYFETLQGLRRSASMRGRRARRPHDLHQTGSLRDRQRINLSHFY